MTNVAAKRTEATRSAEPTAAMIEWVVFDLGEVVLARSTRLPDLAALLDVAEAELAVGYYTHRHALDRDSDPPAYWALIAADLGRPAPDPDTIAELHRIDSEGWSVARPDTLALIEDLHGAGIGLAVCSNAPSSMGRAFEVEPWAHRFRHLVFSGDMGVLKPEPAIYDAVLAATGATAERTVFFDDKVENVDGARRLGWYAFRYTDAEQARRDLAGLGLRLGLLTREWTLRNGPPPGQT